MQRFFRVFLSVALSGAILQGFSAHNTTLNKNFNCRTSHVLVCAVPRPTLAGLDAAAYIGNPVRDNPKSFSPKKPAGKVRIADCTFGGVISSPCAKIEGTPLTESEQASPLAWDALQNRVWQLTKTDVFGKPAAAVNGWKWADSSIYEPYQQIVAAWLHGSGDSASLWVKIEFKPWVNFVDAPLDHNHSGHRCFYGKLDCSGIDHAVFSKVVAWIATDYSRKLLNREQVIDWANTLASYWYPKLNTDIVDMTGSTVWPDDNTEKGIRRELHGFKVADPLIVIRGNPYGEVIYNVFTVDFPAVKSTEAASPAANTPTAPVQPSASTATAPAGKADSALLAETRANGDYPEWAKKDAAFRAANADYVKALPADQKAFAGKDGWLFFRNEIDYLNAGDLDDQPADDNPLVRLKEFKEYLDKQGVAFLFCPVPNKSDIYYEKLPAGTPSDSTTIINPYARKFLRDLQAAGIETVDLLPALLAAKRDDTKSAEALFQKHDTHWTSRGLAITAQSIADRIRQYGWFADAAKVRYSLKDTSCERLGDLVDKLPENERTAYPADQLRAQRVLNADGSLFKATNPEAPIMLIGDSFTGVFELIDCKSAGVGSHIAAATGIPVDVITSWGGGPLVRDKMLRARKDLLPKKKVVIYMMTARDLWHYGQKWAKMHER